MCHVNSRKGKTEAARTKTIFYATPAPDISLAVYLRRIAFCYNCPKECFVLALEYIHRVMNCKPEIQVTYNTVHQLILTCIKVAAKFLDDMVFQNTFYSKVVGVPVVVHSAYEMQLLFSLSFDLFVLPEQYLSRRNTMFANNKGQNKVTLRPMGNLKNK